MAKTGPNDTSGPQVCPFFFLHVFYVFTNDFMLYLSFKNLRRVEVGCDNKTGLKDASGVVWALGTPFSSSCFLYTNQLYLDSIYTTLKARDGLGWKAMAKNRPKRQLSLFGPQVLAFFCLSFFLLLTNVILGLIYEISREKAGLTKTGPNDSIAVVWVLCVFFFFIFLRFFLLTYHLFRSFFV